MLTIFDHLIADAKITSITNNSRDVIKNTLFLAFPGVHVDARHYIGNAIAQGASAILYENKDGFFYHDENIPCVGVADLKNKQASIAAQFYDFPAKKMRVIGVTGTNGKTSITQFLSQLLSMDDQSMGATTSDIKTAVIGTLGYGFPHQLKKLPNTTPDGLQLQKIFFELLSQGAKAVAMEVSSHGLVENRVDQIDFDTAVFTNLTQDHLDFHGTMENYRAAKELLLQKQGLKNAVINADDETGQYFAKKYYDKLNVITFSKTNHNATIYLENKIFTENGFDLIIKTPISTVAFHLPLIGEFNIENILAVIGVLYALKKLDEKTAELLSHIEAVSGRMQLIHKNHLPFVVIDYAHTPDALEKALQSVRAHCRGKLWCIFGCGGNRDKTKRSKMGMIAAKFADCVVITNDNPRDEDPLTIAQEVVAGVNRECIIELDRALAIQNTLKKADKNDWVLIAGKGHETDQIIGNQVLHHNDAECVNQQ